LSNDQRQKLLKNIEGFILGNSKNITQIFNENRIRFYEMPFITQPEIFIAWFCLDHYYFEITDNWENDFDISELVMYSPLLGQRC
jgi:hypothetical protein